MALAASFNASFSGGGGLNANFQPDRQFNANFGSITSTTGNNVVVDTTEGWNSQPQLIGRENIVYVYTDYLTGDNGEKIPGFKVGDGLAYLIDLPFNGDLFLQHVQDTSIHVTDAEKAFWNNKVTAFIDAENLENLVLTKE